MAARDVGYPRGKLRGRRRLEVFGSFHLLISLITQPGSPVVAHVGLQRVPVDSGVSDLLKSVDLSRQQVKLKRIGRISVQGSIDQHGGPTWKLCGLLQAMPLMMVLPPRARPARTVVGWLFADD